MIGFARGDADTGMDSIFDTSMVAVAILPIFSLTLPQQRAAVGPVISNVTMTSLTPVLVVAVCYTWVIIQTSLSFNHE